MYCKKCGAAIQPGSKFCGKCGSAAESTIIGSSGGAQMFNAANQPMNINDFIVQHGSNRIKNLRIASWILWGLSLFGGIIMLIYLTGAISIIDYVTDMASTASFTDPGIEIVVNMILNIYKFIIILALIASVAAFVLGGIACFTKSKKLTAVYSIISVFYGWAPITRSLIIISNYSINEEYDDYLYYFGRQNFFPLNTGTSYAIDINDYFTYYGSANAKRMKTASWVLWIISSMIELLFYVLIFIVIIAAATSGGADTIMWVIVMSIGLIGSLVILLFGCLACKKRDKTNSIVCLILSSLLGGLLTKIASTLVFIFNCELNKEYKQYLRQFEAQDQGNPRIYNTQYVQSY